MNFITYRTVLLYSVKTKREKEHEKPRLEFLNPPNTLCFHIFQGGLHFHIQNTDCIMSNVVNR